MTEALDALIEANEQARAELLDALDALPAERRVEGWFGPEAWSAKDILAHIARWQAGWAVALGQIAERRAPRDPGVRCRTATTPRRPRTRSTQSRSRAPSDLSWEQVLARTCAKHANSTTRPSVASPSSSPTATPRGVRRTGSRPRPNTIENTPRQSSPGVVSRGYEFDQRQGDQRQGDQRQGDQG